MNGLGPGFFYSTLVTQRTLRLAHFSAELTVYLLYLGRSYGGRVKDSYAGKRVHAHALGIVKGVRGGSTKMCFTKGDGQENMNIASLHSQTPTPSTPSMNFNSWENFPFVDPSARPRI